MSKNGGKIQREPVVFVEPSVSSRKRITVASLNIMSKKGGEIQREPVVFGGSAFSQECPQIGVTFGCSSEVYEMHEQSNVIMAERKKSISKKEGQLFVRAVNRILKSLTPETFRASVEQLKKLSLNTEERLQEVVNLIFESAMRGPDSAELYARMCNSLSTVEAQSTADPTSSVSFRILLIRRCRADYELILGNDANFHRSIGTIKLMGELFLTNILSSTVMHSCIKRLLQNKDADSLECLCELFQIIRVHLETATTKQVMNNYYDQMLVIAKDEKTSSRISLMLQTTTQPKKRRMHFQ